MFANISNISNSQTVTSIMKDKMSRSPFGNITNNYHLRQWNNICYHKPKDSMKLSSNLNRMQTEANLSSIAKEDSGNVSSASPMGSIYSDLINSRRMSFLQDLLRNRPMDQYNANELSLKKKSPSKIPVARFEMFEAVAKSSTRNFETLKKSPTKIPVAKSPEWILKSLKDFPAVRMPKGTPPKKPARKFLNTPNGKASPMSVKNTPSKNAAQVPSRMVANAVPASAKKLTGKRDSPLPIGSALTSPRGKAVAMITKNSPIKKVVAAEVHSAKGIVAKTNDSPVGKKSPSKIPVKYETPKKNATLTPSKRKDGLSGIKIMITPSKNDRSTTITIKQSSKIPIYCSRSSLNSTPQMTRESSSISTASVSTDKKYFSRDDAARKNLRCKVEHGSYTKNPNRHRNCYTQLQKQVVKVRQGAKPVFSTTAEIHDRSQQTKRCLSYMEANVVNSTPNRLLEEDAKTDFKHANGEPISPIRKQEMEDNADPDLSLSSKFSTANTQITAIHKTNVTHNPCKVHGGKILQSSAMNLNEQDVDSIVEYANNSFAIPNRINGTYTVLDNVTEAFFSLKQEADVQCNIMKQASKALDCCRNQPNVNLYALIEAEKILLIANARYELLLAEIRENRCLSEKEIDHVGTVQLGTLTVELNSKRKETEWFIAIVSYREQIFNTKMIEVAPHQKLLVFDEGFKFLRLNADFKLAVNIYSYKSRKPSRDRISCFNKKVTTLCRKSKKFFYKDLQTSTLMESKIPSSSFQLTASMFVSVKNVANGDGNNFSQLASDSSISGNLKLDAQITDVKMTTFKRGFLNVGMATKYGLVWNRRWSLLTNSELLFWNYPSEEDNCEPAQIVALAPTGTRIAVADRSECAKPKTLTLQVEEGSKYFLSADSGADMKNWKEQLDTVIGTLENFNILKSSRSTDL